MKKGLGIVIFIFILVMVWEGSAVANDMEYVDVEDAELGQFLEKHLIADSVPVESEIIHNYKCVNVFSQNMDAIDDNIVGEVYTYAAEVDGTTVYQTVLDLRSVEKIKVSKADIVELELNDYLSYYSPVEGELWTKKAADGYWEYQREIIPPLLSLYSVTLYGNQIKTRDDYFRIFIYFQADKDTGSTASMPAYVINYTNVRGMPAVMLLTFGKILLALCVSVIAVRFIIKRLKK